MIAVMYIETVFSLVQSQMFNLHIDSKSVGNWVAKKNFVSQNYVGY